MFDILVENVMKNKYKHVEVIMKKEQPKRKRLLRFVPEAPPEKVHHKPSVVEKRSVHDFVSNRLVDSDIPDEDYIEEENGEER